MIDGKVEGMITMPNNTLVIGPNSEVRADIQARTLVLEGRLKGKAHIRDRMEIKKRGTMEGELVTHRLVIEDGAIFCGTSEVQPPETPPVAPAARPAAKAEPPVSPGPKPVPVRVKA